MKICPKCDKSYFVGDYCENCGSPLRSGELPAEVRLKTTIGGRTNRKIVESDLKKERDRMLFVSDEDDIGTSRVRTRQGEEQFCRAPRLRKKLPDDVVEISAPPNPARRPEINWLTTILPVITTVCLAIVMTFVMNSRRMLLFTVPMALVGLLITWINYRRQIEKFRENSDDIVAAYAGHLNKAVEKLENIRLRQLEAMEYSDGSVGQCGKIAMAREKRLWERTPEDPDFLSVRIGSGKTAISAEIRIPREVFSIEHYELSERPRQIYDEYCLIDKAPVIWGLAEAGVCGVVGDSEDREILLQNMIVQLATRHSYSELKIVVVCDESQKERMLWIRDLPHARDSSRKEHFVAASREEAAALLDKFCEILKRRKISVSEKTGYGKNPVVLPYFLFVFLQPAYLPKTDPIVEYLFHSKDLSTSVIMTADDLNDLPRECKSIVELNCHEGQLYSKVSATQRAVFYLDTADEEFYYKFGRSLKNLVCNEELSRDIIPGMFTLCEMYEVERISDIDIRALWRQGDSVRSLAVPIGAMEKGRILELDIHERADGPHGLMAGATGYGKSELLQSYILSAALNFHPHELGFFVIDFKSGLPNGFDRLPHMLGVIRDIDGGSGDKQLDRSLMSLKAELDRRKELFAREGVKDILAYNRGRREGRISEPCPQIIVVVDEFAELKMMKPEFIKELVSAARVGRSLGIHLILAAQNISGQVDDQISANSRFRLCLHVNSEAQSREMINSNLAAAIVEKGRAYLKVGNERLELFQSAYSGAPDPGDPGVSQQTAAIEHICSFCEREKISRLRPLCLPMLPELALYPGTEREEGGNICINAGIYDAPERQLQAPVIFPIAGCNSLVVGASRSGKTNLLQLVIRGISEKYTPDEVSIYVIDCASSFLKNFEGLPHVGGVACAAEEERMNNLFKMLSSEIAMRKQRFMLAGVGSYIAYREAGYVDLPQIVLLIDNFTTLRDVFLTEEDRLLPIMREGAGLGISTVITNPQTGGISSHYHVLISNRLAFFCNQNDEYSNLFGYTKQRPDNIPGRCLCHADAQLCEAQTWLAFEGQREVDRSAAVRRYVKDRAENWRGHCARPIPGVPEELDPEDIYSADGSMDRRESFALGMDYGTVEPVTLPFDDQFMLTLMGKDGANKRAYMDTLMNDLLQNMNRRAAKVYFVDSLRREYSSCEDMPFVEKYSARPESLMEILEKVREELSSRGSCFELPDGNGLAAEPLLLIIVNNARALEMLSESKPHIKIFEEIAKEYRDWKVMFLMADVDNKTVGYGSGEMLRKIRDERKALIFDSLRDVKFYDIPGAALRSNKNVLGAGDAYYLNGDEIRRIKLVGRK